MSIKAVREQNKMNIKNALKARSELQEKARTIRHAISVNEHDTILALIDGNQTYNLKVNWSMIERGQRSKACDCEEIG